MRVTLVSLRDRVPGLVLLGWLYKAYIQEILSPDPQLWNQRGPRPSSLIRHPTGAMASGRFPRTKVTCYNRKYRGGLFPPPLTAVQKEIQAPKRGKASGPMPTGSSIQGRSRRHGGWRLPSDLLWVLLGLPECLGASGPTCVLWVPAVCAEKRVGPELCGWGRGSCTRSLRGLAPALVLP